MQTKLEEDAVSRVDHARASGSCEPVAIYLYMPRITASTWCAAPAAPHPYQWDMLSDVSGGAYAFDQWMPSLKRYWVPHIRCAASGPRECAAAARRPARALLLQHRGARGCGRKPPPEDSAVKETQASAPTLATQ